MDKEFLGVRRRALEEEYFAKVNRALIARIREAERAVFELADASECGDVKGDPWADLHPKAH